MKSFPARQAKQCIGDIIAASQTAPVSITFYNKPVAVVMTHAQYRTLLTACDPARRGAMEHIVDELAGGNHRSYSRRMLAALRVASLR